MKILRLMLALLVVASFAATAPAQVIIHRGRRNVPAVPPNPQGLVALQQDLIKAIESMKSALPIYDGNRVRSIHAAHAALVIVDREINGPTGATRPVPTVKDGEKRSKYTPSEVTGSQTNMRNALALLQQGTKDLSAATGSNPNQKGAKVRAHLQVAISEATIAIQLHAAQG
jgi:hypothetical protein